MAFAGIARRGAFAAGGSQKRNVHSFRVKHLKKIASALEIKGRSKVKGKEELVPLIINHLRDTNEDWNEIDFQIRTSVSDKDVSNDSNEKCIKELSDVFEEHNTRRLELKVDQDENEGRWELEVVEDENEDNEMDYLYECLADDNVPGYCDGAIYLVDGVFLYPDGSTRDEKREM